MSAAAASGACAGGCVGECREVRPMVGEDAARLGGQFVRQRVEVGSAEALTPCGPAERERKSCFAYLSPSNDKGLCDMMVNVCLPGSPPLPGVVVVWRHGDYIFAQLQCILGMQVGETPRIGSDKEGIMVRNRSVMIRPVTLRDLELFTVSGRVTDAFYEADHLILVV